MADPSEKPSESIYHSYWLIVYSISTHTPICLLIDLSLADNHSVVLPIILLSSHWTMDDFPWRLETPTNTDICFRSRMPRCRVDPGKIILSPILYRTYDWKGGSTPPSNCKPSSNSEFQPQMATLFHIWSCRILGCQNIPLDERSYVIRCISENGNSFNCGNSLAPFWNLIWISKHHGKSSNSYYLLTVS